jgi:hypothetical protein
MAQDEWRRGRLDRLGGKPPASSIRVLLVAALAAQALVPHGISAELDVTLTVTSHRIGVLHACNLAETAHATPRECSAAQRETER